MPKHTPPLSLFPSSLIEGQHLFHQRSTSLFFHYFNVAIYELTKHAARPAHNWTSSSGLSAVSERWSLWLEALGGKRRTEKRNTTGSMPFARTVSGRLRGGNHRVMLFPFIQSESFKNGFRKSFFSFLFLLGNLGICIAFTCRKILLTLLVYGVEFPI